MSGIGPPLSIRIEDIFEEFYSDAAEDKYIHLIRAIDIFTDQFDLRPGKKDFLVNVESFKLRALVHSYYLDVIRYKEYNFNPSKEDTGGKKIAPFSLEWVEYIHDSRKKISDNKAASLTCKWLMKYLPIQIHPRDYNCVLSDDEEQVILNYNAFFSLSHCADILDISISEEDISPLLYEELLYHLRYRNFDERHFYMVFGLISNSYK